MVIFEGLIFTLFLLSLIVFTACVLYKIIIYFNVKLPIYREILFRINVAIDTNKDCVDYKFDNDSLFRDSNLANVFAKEFDKYCQKKCKKNLDIKLKIDSYNRLEFVKIHILSGDEGIRKITLEETI